MWKMKYVCNYLQWVKSAHDTHTAFLFKSNDGIKILDNKCMKDGNGACKDLKHAKILVLF